jgi:hypothetical protein
MAKQKFNVKLLGHAGSDAAILKPPFDVAVISHRKGRVPVKGTLNGFPFRIH